MNANLCAEQIIKWHEHYCGRLRACVEQYAPGEVYTPRIMFAMSVRNWIAYYNKAHHVCVYSLPYAMSLGMRFEEVVAHECAHGYQYQFGWKPKVHSELFYFLLRNVCGFEYAQRTLQSANKLQATKIAMVLNAYDYVPPLQVTDEARHKGRRRRKRRAG